MRGNRKLYGSIDRKRLSIPCMALAGLFLLACGAFAAGETVTDNEGATGYDEAAVLVSTSLTAGLVSGELKQWHKVTITFDGPGTSETGSPNPFRDYRLNVFFSHPASGKSYTVPGYYAADGNAADTGADSGNKWRVHFAPDERGAWIYRSSFRTGIDIAVSDVEHAGAGAGFFDGALGSFEVLPSDKTGRDFRSKGTLKVVGKHHLQFAGTGEYFLKCGADAPENLFAYNDFDATPNAGNRRKSWSPHAGDYAAAEAAAYTWAGGKGTELLGAIRYLASEGLNAFSFLTFNIDGDDDNVFPHRLTSTTAAYEAIGDNQRWANNGVYHDRFDVSKLDQWERIFCYGDQLGMYLHFKTQETENEQRMDGGHLGVERTLYYRELVARFSHHLALNWNLGEEINNASTAQKKAWAAYFWNHDPYQHNIVIHNGNDHYDLLGSASDLTGFSLQTNQPDFSQVHSRTMDYIDRSVASRKRWVVACDEPGDASHALRPDNDAGNSHVDGRKNGLWGNLMAGGAGIEWYFGYNHAHSDLTCQDWRSRDTFWDVCRYALEFFNRHIPFWRMQTHNELIGNAGNNVAQGFCLAETGEVYVVYLPTGGAKQLDLSGVSGTFSVHWFDPRNGGVLQTGAVETVTAGGSVTIGPPPSDTSNDWAALVRRPVRVLFTRGGSDWGDAPDSDQQFLDRFGLVMNQDQGFYTLDRTEDHFLTANHPILRNVDAFGGEGVSPIVHFSDSMAGVRATVVANTGLDRLAGHFDRNTFFNMNGAETSLHDQDNTTCARNLLRRLASGEAGDDHTDQDGLTDAFEVWHLGSMATSSGGLSEDQDQDGFIDAHEDTASK